MAITLDGTNGITTPGNVGIGTVSPSETLELSQASGDLIQKFNGATATFGIRNQSDGSFGHFDFTNSRWLDLRQYSSDNYKLYTAGTERVTIDSSGRVTMPYQPAFQVASQSSPVSAGSKVGWASKKFDRGSHFDLTNERYTAPVSGIYWMHVSFHISGGCAAPARPCFRVNGSDYSIGPDACQTIMNITGSEHSIDLAVHMTLSAGDYVEVFARSGSGSLAFYTGHSWWSGHLVG